MIDLRLILACARLSNAVYDVFLAGKVAPENAVAFDEGGSHILCQRLPDAILVAYQGTDSSDAADIMSNLRIDPRPGPNGGWCHAGYKSYALAPWGAVRGWLDQVDDGRPIIFTGHSRGGAAATIAAAFWQDHCSCVSFGAPKPGNSAFWGKISWPVYRVTVANDFATEYPTMFGVPVPGYTQGGQELRLSPSGIVPLAYLPMQNRGRQDLSEHDAAKRYLRWAEMAAA